MSGKTYRVKEAFYTLQGEGAQAGRPAVFCRFSKCNLWNGREDARATAICDFCDTDFIGIDGQNGGQYTASELVALMCQLWPQAMTQTQGSQPYIVCTGGEPLLQLDEALVAAFQQAGFEVAVETNGTLPAPANLDWICLSPKADADVVLKQCHELKLVYPQEKAMPERFNHIKAEHYYLQPMASCQPNVIAADGLSVENTRKTVEYCLQHPQWKLSLQAHKLLGID